MRNTLPIYERISLFDGGFYFLKQVQIALSGIERDFIHLSY